MWTAQQRHELDAMSLPDRVALIDGERPAGRALLSTLAAAFDVVPRSVSEAGLTPSPARTSNELLERLGDSSFLYDLQSLCWQPWLQIDALRFLRAHARRRGVVALWPGRISAGAATFSAPGRHDHVSFDLSGLSVLRPLITQFPDEVPFAIERTP
jgi:hypothetical protein